MLTAEGKIIVIINPKEGDLKSDASTILANLTKKNKPENGITIGIHLGPNDRSSVLQGLLNKIPPQWNVALIHYNYPNALESAQALAIFSS